MTKPHNSNKLNNHKQNVIPSVLLFNSLYNLMILYIYNNQDFSKKIIIFQTHTWNKEYTLLIKCTHYN